MMCHGFNVGWMWGPLVCNNPLPRFVVFLLCSMALNFLWVLNGSFVMFTINYIFGLTYNLVFFFYQCVQLNSRERYKHGDSLLSHWYSLPKTWERKWRQWVHWEAVGVRCKYRFKIYSLVVIAMRIRFLFIGFPNR